MGKRWTAEEDETLRTWYAKLGAKELHERWVKPNHTAAAVRRRAQVLGLSAPTPTTGRPGGPTDEDRAKSSQILAERTKMKMDALVPVLRMWQENKIKPTLVEGQKDCLTVRVEKARAWLQATYGSGLAAVTLNALVTEHYPPPSNGSQAKHKEVTKTQQTDHAKEWRVRFNVLEKELFEIKELLQRFLSEWYGPKSDVKITGPKEQ